MPFRERLKKKFSSKKTDSGESTPTSETPPRRTDIEYYEPHEIPRSKYRGRVDKKHQEKLESFSWTDAFASVRKGSLTPSGAFSPGGTKSQSRRPSWISRNRSSISTVTTTVGSERDNKSIRRKSAAAQGTPAETSVKEDEEQEQEEEQKTPTE